MQVTTHLLYLHGFRSSPQSAKAQRVASRVDQWRVAGLCIDWLCPQLPASPRHALADIERLTADWPDQTMAVIGSSLGGYYATAVAERRGCRAAVINPAVAPARSLARHIAEHGRFANPDDQRFFQPAFVHELAALNPHPITRPDRYWALIAEGDEVLDWREMDAHYRGAQIKRLPGSDHAVTDFEDHLPDLLAFLGLPP